MFVQRIECSKAKSHISGINFFWLCMCKVSVNIDSVHNSAFMSTVLRAVLTQHHPFPDYCVRLPRDLIPAAGVVMAWSQEGVLVGVPEGSDGLFSCGWLTEIAHKRKVTRSVWVRSIFMQCRQQGEYQLQEIWLSDPKLHFHYLRMSTEGYDVLLEKVNTCIC